MQRRKKRTGGAERSGFRRRKLLAALMLRVRDLGDMLERFGDAMPNVLRDREPASFVDVCLSMLHAVRSHAAIAATLPLVFTTCSPVFVPKISHKPPIPTSAIAPTKTIAELAIAPTSLLGSSIGAQLLTCAGFKHCKNLPTFKPTF